MKKLLIGLLALALGASAADAQLLWKVSGNGIKNESYLFGTHHLAPVAILDSVAGFADALGAVSAVVGEIDMADAANPAMAQQLVGLSMAPADSTLNVLLNAAQLDSVNTLLAKYTGGMLTVDQLAALKPAVVSTQLAMLENLTDPQMAAAIQSGRQLDSEIQRLGREVGKQVKAFETLEQQMSILMGGSLTEQASDLMETVRSCMEGTANEQVRRLNAAYMSRNLNEIESLFLSDEEMSADQLKRLITDRNEEWVKQLGAMMPEGPVMVAVGCGHLPGPMGLITLLRNAGYTVEPVK